MYFAGDAQTDDIPPWYVRMCLFPRLGHALALGNARKYRITHQAIRRKTGGVLQADLDAVGSSPDMWSGANGWSGSRLSAGAAAAFRREVEQWRNSSRLHEACASLAARGAEVTRERGRRAALRRLAAAAGNAAGRVATVSGAS